MAGFEPATFRLEVWRAIQLRHTDIIWLLRCRSCCWGFRRCCWCDVVEEGSAGIWTQIIGFKVQSANQLHHRTCISARFRSLGLLVMGQALFHWATEIFSLGWFEHPTNGFTVHCSPRLSYSESSPYGFRTHDLGVISTTLWPTELRDLDGQIIVLSRNPIW